MNQYSDLLNKYKFKVLPVNYIYYKGKQVNASPGKLSKSAAITFLDYSLYDIQNGKIANFDHIKDQKSIELLSHPFQSIVRSYYQSTGYKALAITITDNGKWWTSRIGNRNDQKTASEEALKKCNIGREKRKAHEPCVLYAEGNHFVYKDTDKENLLALENEFSELDNKIFGKTEMNIDSFFEKYKHKHNHYSAVAVAISKKGSWQSGVASGNLTQQDAITQAFKRCEKHKNKRKIKNACTLYAVGDKKVYRKNQQEIDDIVRRMPKQKTRMDKNFQRYKKYKQYKAMTLVHGKDGKWSSRWSYGYKSQQAANAAALKGCEKNKVSKKIIGECRLYAIGDKILSN